MDTKQSHYVARNLSGGWSVRSYGAKRSTRRFKDRREAVSFAKQLSRRKGVPLYVFDWYGQVEHYFAFEGGSLRRVV